MSNTLERDIERKLSHLVEGLGGMCLKWTCPGHSGVPDRICLLPGGRVYFIETKRPKGGKISSLQRWWNRKLNDLGCPSFFVSNSDDLEALRIIILDDLGRR